MMRLKFYGIGGQGVVTAAKALSVAVSLHEDKHANTIPAYGHERRGAPVYTDLVIDEDPILVNCFVYEPDVVLVMDDSILTKHPHVNVGNGIHKGTRLVLNTSSAEVAKTYAATFGFAETWYTDGTAIALQCLGRSIPNSSMLGALSKAGVVKIESVQAALRELFGKNGEKNADAARKAYENTTCL